MIRSRMAMHSDYRRLAQMSYFMGISLMSTYWLFCQVADTLKRLGRDAREADRGIETILRATQNPFPFNRFGGAQVTHECNDPDCRIHRPESVIPNTERESSND